MWYVIPTNLVCVFFGPPIPTSFFNFIQLFFILVAIELMKFLLCSFLLKALRGSLLLISLAVYCVMQYHNHSEYFYL